MLSKSKLRIIYSWPTAHIDELICSNGFECNSGGNTLVQLSGLFEHEHWEMSFCSFFLLSKKRRRKKINGKKTNNSSVINEWHCWWWCSRCRCCQENIFMLDDNLIQRLQIIRRNIHLISLLSGFEKKREKEKNKFGIPSSNRN
ncbi:hypothetical protein BpHYR1_036504 [Brachionus plicatilis]|uniref:Uncharacterized protein n=1 Tax=Brachionus plicatilis TaxID=10195 RepID=A0A3M7RPB8_BRAPC|nr:hypothetical protein BpHYR1_036504 [Brachionus plicatilis]